MEEPPKENEGSELHKLILARKQGTLDSSNNLRQLPLKEDDDTYFRTRF